MKKILSTSFLIIIIAWGAYYLNFGIDGDISQKTDVWGQFGDYLGGVLNPILSFISIYLLINSLSLQHRANASLVDEIKRQEKLEEFKKFEFRFFHLIDSLDKTFSRFKVCIGEIDSKDDRAFEEYNGGAAVTYIEDSIIVLVDNVVDKGVIIAWLDDVDSDDCLFSVVRRFYLIVKLIEENNFDHDDYQEMLVNLTDIKIITLVAIACSYYQWDIVNYINNSGVLKREGINEFVEKITHPSDK
ncbi:hypothetical protein [Aeromonas caviae]|jgi:hypothetical protein|uniref:hypothetical protein n=1 Tax=Aeromonas caviae TaxID=648 RepID=UPI000FADA7CF|nr:hypothetical protein [Aeromonas caviae]MBL0518510.1 hypothetical protein [Aeromonas caviae]